MKKRMFKITAIVLAVLLAIVVCVFANGLFGNPLSKLLATNTAKKHIEEVYNDKDFEIERVMFSFKDGYYYALIVSPSSIDSIFSLCIDMWGGLRLDTYEDLVLSGVNTAGRIDDEYRKKVDEVLDSQEFPYDAHIGFGAIEFVSRRYAADESILEYALIMEELTIDASYDVNDLGAKAGNITMYLYDDTVSYERLSEVILDLKRIFDEAGVKFYTFDIVLEYPKNENGSGSEGRVEVQNFIYSDIYEDGIVERVKASDEAAKAYYREQDAQKLKETTDR